MGEGGASRANNAIKSPPPPPLFTQLEMCVMRGCDGGQVQGCGWCNRVGATEWGRGGAQPALGQVRGTECGRGGAQPTLSPSSVTQLPPLSSSSLSLLPPPAFSHAKLGNQVLFICIKINKPSNQLLRERRPQQRSSRGGCSWSGTSITL